MKRREFMGALAGAAAPAAPRRPPNVIVILTDDLGWAELGCYGNRFNETPNLDRLASQGVRFTQAYTPAPVCSPTRAAYMTGQYPARVGITDFLRADDPKFLSPDTPSFPKQFAAAGYATGLIGKWHLMGSYDRRPGDPLRHGFQHVICSETRYIGPGYYNPPYRHMPEVQPRAGYEYLTDRLNREAVEFVSANARTPFLLCLNHYAPHTALVGKPDMVARYSAKSGAATKVNNPKLAAMLESIDQGAGLLMSHLDRLGLAENTILIFTSDNGGETRVTTNGHLHGGKSELYEGGIRVPLIVRWPGVAKAGGIADAPVCTIDFQPTLLAAARLQPPRGHIVDGTTLVPLLQQPEAGLKPRPLYWHYPLDKPHALGGRSSGAMRQGDLKLIEFYDTNTVELYDLKADPGENKDLSAAMPAQAAEMRAALRQWRARTMRKSDA